MYALFESSAGLLASSIVEIPSLCLLSLDSTLHATFTFQSITATTATTATGDTWALLGGFYLRNEGKIHAKLGAASASGAIDKHYDYSLEISSLEGTLRIGGLLEMRVRHVAVWKDPRAGLLHSFSPLDLHVEFSAMSGLLHAWQLPYRTSQVLIDSVTSAS